MAAKRDYYDVLGVPRDASEGDIKKAFRRLAREFHPDVNSDPEAGERFREAAEAYEVLSDAETRARYDRFGHAGVAGTPLHTEQFMDFGSLSDLLGAFFGDDLFAGAARRRPARGGDAQVSIGLTFVEAAFGATREVEVDVVQPCERCEGSGAEPGTDPVTCRVCDGAGRVSHVQSTAFGQFVRTSACAACGGRGTVVESPCTRCRGRGRVAEEQRVQVEIPAGIMDGQRLRLAGRGHAGEPGAAPGDLYVNVSVAADARFERDGADLVSVIDVPFTRAALGGTVSVETIEGPEEVDIPAGLQPNQVIVLRGKGVHALGRRGRGDHRLVANVRVPRRLTDEQRRLLERFEASVEDSTYEDQSFFGRLRAALR